MHACVFIIQFHLIYTAATVNSRLYCKVKTLQYYEQALGNSGKENLPFNRKELWQNQAQEGAAICGDRFRVRRGRRDESQTGRKLSFLCQQCFQDQNQNTLLKEIMWVTVPVQSRALHKSLYLIVQHCTNQLTILYPLSPCYQVQKCKKF